MLAGERAVSKTSLNPDSPLNPEPEKESDLQIVIDQPEFGGPRACIRFHRDCDRLSKPRSVT